MKNPKTEAVYRPAQIDIELTTACNHSCRYCYNFWRHEGVKDVFMSKGAMDTLINDMIELEVTNVVLTGGEPFANYDVLLHAVKRLSGTGINISCNSNLTLATGEQLRELKEAGLPHILTSLASYNPEVNDTIFGKKSYQKIINSIQLAVEAGIKISINNVITSHNKDHVYRTGLLASELGVSNLFVTRVVPSTACNPEIAIEFMIDNYYPVLDGAIEVKEETGINVGSLIQYPVCFLKDTERYKDFIGRGCPAGKGMVCISADGETHACFHEEKSYGNALEIGIEGAWRKMVVWRDGSLLPEACRKCNWLKWCEGGCRVSATSLNESDYMCVGGLAKSTEGYEKYTVKETWKKHDR